MRLNFRNSTLNLMFVAALGALLLAPSAWAASFESDAASTDWDEPTAWTAGSAFPAAGDDVIIHHNRTVDGPEEFGSSTSNSFWSTGTTRLDLDSHTLTHSGNSTLHLTAGNNYIGCLSGPKSWIFSNAVGSVFSHDVAGTLLLWCGTFNGDQGAFVNRGTYRFTAAGTLAIGRSAWFKNHGTIRNDSGGQASILNSLAESASFSNDVGAVVEADGAGSILLYKAQRLMDGGGTWRALNGGEIRLDPTLTPGGVLGVSPNTVFHGDVASAGLVDISGDWSVDMLGIATGNVSMAANNLMVILQDITVDMDASGASGGTDADAVAGTLVWRRSGTQGIDLEESTLTIDTPSSMSGGDLFFGSSGSPNKIGTVVNASGNTFTHAFAGSMKIFCISAGVGGVSFRNEGLFVFTKAAGSVAITFTENTFHITTGATVRASTGFGNTASFTATGQLSNQGTLEVLSGKLDVAAAIEFPQFDSGSLTGGIYDVTGTLDLNRAAGITTIGTDSIVRFRGSSAAFTEFDGNLTTVNGSFGLYSGMVYNAGASLTIPGTLEFGLADSDASAAVVKTGISNAVNVTLTGGEVDIIDAGLTGPGTFTLIEFTGTQTGTLTLDEFPNDGLIYTLIHNAQNVQLNVASPPSGAVYFVE